MNNIPYLAGLFDGEGTVYIQFSRRPTRYKVGAFILTISVTNTNLEILTLFKTSFGGEIYSHPGTNKKCYRWTLSASKAGVFLKVLLPHLIVKKQQALIGIELQNHLDTSKFSRWLPIDEKTIRYRESLHFRCSQLNH